MFSLRAAGPNVASAGRQVINGITVTRTIGAGTETIAVPAETLVVAGPLGERVVATLTHSPRSVVLDSSEPTPPPGWRSLSFGGLTFAVPPSWAVQTTPLVGGCPGNLRPGSLTLSSATMVSSVGCPSGPVTAGAKAGVDAAVIDSGPQVPDAPAGASCTDRQGLHVCVDPDPEPDGSGQEFGVGPGILTAQITEPGAALRAQIDIGLSADGTTALGVFDSLRPAPSSQPSAYPLRARPLSSPLAGPPARARHWAPTSPGTR